MKNAWKTATYIVGVIIFAILIVLIILIKQYLHYISF